MINEDHYRETADPSLCKVPWIEMWFGSRFISRIQFSKWSILFLLPIKKFIQNFNLSKPNHWIATQIGKINRDWTARFICIGKNNRDSNKLIVIQFNYNYKLRFNFSIHTMNRVFSSRFNFSIRAIRDFYRNLIFRFNIRKQFNRLCFSGPFRHTSADGIIYGSSAYSVIVYCVTTEKHRLFPPACEIAVRVGMSKPVV